MCGQFLTGLDVLLEQEAHLLRRRRVGLVTHAAALNRRGAASAELLFSHPDIDLRLLMGPEHGLLGQAGAGETVASVTHPGYGVPVHSLYGGARKPTAEMIDSVDVVVVDLQDLAVRCYTYVSTLALVMEAAAEAGKPMVVADRPVPLPDTVDGPMLDDRFRSFVGYLPAPMVYGMTPGETARFLHRRDQMVLDLHVVPMQGYVRDPARPPGAPPWVPPSPGIRSWDGAQIYPATVCCEALPALDFGAGTGLPFQLLGAPWLQGRAVCDALTEVGPLGAAFHPHWYVPSAATGGAPWEGVRIAVTDPRAFRPIETCLHLIKTLSALYGPERLWHEPPARPGFFDQLFGTDAVRQALQSSVPVPEITAEWSTQRGAFDRLREACLLYPPIGTVRA